jgi:hypothetical protein
MRASYRDVCEVAKLMLPIGRPMTNLVPAWSERDTNQGALAVELRRTIDKLEKVRARCNAAIDGCQALLDKLSAGDR